MLCFSCALRLGGGLTLGVVTAGVAPQAPTAVGGRGVLPAQRAVAFLSSVLAEPRVGGRWFVHRLPCALSVCFLFGADFPSASLGCVRHCPQSVLQGEGPSCS